MGGKLGEKIGSDLEILQVNESILKEFMEMNSRESFGDSRLPGHYGVHGDERKTGIRRRMMLSKVKSNYGRSTEYTVSIIFYR